MPRDAVETERLASLACEELARLERRLPTVKSVMDAIGIQSPEVVGRALKRWREGFIARALAEDTSLGLPAALVEPLQALMALAHTEARRELGEARAALEAERTAMEAALATERTAREAAQRRAEDAEQALAVFQTAGAEERQDKAAQIANLERRLQEASGARAEVERSLATESERRAALERRLSAEVERLQDEKLYLGAEHAEVLEAQAQCHQEELTRLKGALTGLEGANRRQHEDLATARARERQAHEAAARLRGEQEEVQRGMIALREALSAREGALAEAQASVSGTNARAALLEADLGAARGEVASLRAEEARLSVALTQAQTELAVVNREGTRLRRGQRGGLSKKDAQR